MAKEKDKSDALSKDERKALKKEKRSQEGDKKRSEVDGVHKPKDTDERKKKKKKKERAALAEKVSNAVEDGTIIVQEGGEKTVTKKEENEAEEQDDKDTKKDGSKKATIRVSARPVGALVPFANPLADEKVAGKVFKGVKKAASTKSLKRGVKEVVKALRKSPTNTALSFPPSGVVILAADVSPMDVISHIPVLCEDHSIPYIYVTSRAELGMAGQTKRPTSVVMLTANVGGKPKKDGEKERDGQVEWKDSYEKFVKVVEREGKHVRI